MLLRLYIKKFKSRGLLVPKEVSKVDKLATMSLFFGSASLGAFLLSLVFGSMLFWIVVAGFGILAIIFGNHALKKGTSKILYAKIGRAFGWTSIIILAFILSFVILFFSTAGIR